MITIYAEKPDMGTKIAAALDGVYLDSGRVVSFDELGKYENAVKSQRTKDGKLSITWLGERCEVVWGYGHMCELKQAQDYDPSYKNWKNIPLPYIPEEYGLKLKDGVSKQYAIVKKCFMQSDLIICATDDDREGDLIFDYLYRYMGCKVPFKRAVFNKQSQEEFRKAFAREALIDGDDRMDVISAGRARSAGDFVVGAGLTVAMTLKFPGRDVWSVGRVQTATLDLVYERDEEIRKFKPEPYYTVTGIFTDGSRTYMGTAQKKRMNAGEATDAMRELRRSPDAVVEEVKEKRLKRERPFLYNLQALQMDANKKFGYSLDRVLKTAQSLYEKGYTTYPRTDSMQLPEDIGSELEKVFRQLRANPKYSRQIPDAYRIPISDKKYFDNSKVGSHYAIIPTSQPVRNLTKEEENVYDLIVKTLLCMLYPDAEAALTTILTKAGGLVFETKGTVITKPGFYAVMGMPKEIILPAVKRDDHFHGKYAMQKKMTEPPKHYTDASLLNAMMTCGKHIEDDELRKLMAKGPGGSPRGLGRPSSQAGIVETLLTRKYISKKGTSILLTNRGRNLIEKFPVQDLKSAVMTAQWEKRLDDIETGNDTYESFMHDLEGSVRKWTKQVQEMKGEPMEEQEQKERYEGEWVGNPGKMTRFVREWGGHRFTDEECERLLAGDEVEIHGLKGKNGTYGAVGALEEQVYNKHKYIGFKPNRFLNDGGGEQKQKYTGKWAGNGKEVTFTREFGGHVFTDEECEQLLAGDTIQIHGLKGKNGSYGVEGSLKNRVYKKHKFVGFDVDSFLDE